MMAHAPNTLTLVGDIGGTNTRVALAKGTTVLPETVRRYANAEFPGLESVLRRFIADEGGVDPAAACIAVAGPVRDGRAALTNLDWTIDEATLARAARAETVAILNDLQAQGYALGHIAADRTRIIIPSPSSGAGASQLVIGVGTGFNAAPVFEAPGGRFVPPSESGHVNLPVRDAADMRLCEWVSTAHGFPAVEDVLSGRGLERVYAWLGHEEGEPGEAHAADIMAEVARGGDSRARRAAAVMARFLGIVAGNLALIQLPFGGVWLAGGVARALAPYLIEFGFVNAFRDKGRFSGFMTNFGVAVIEDDFAALTGSAAYSGALLRRRRGLT
jgi:glucokinase